MMIKLRFFLSSLTDIILTAILLLSGHFLEWLRPFQLNQKIFSLISGFMIIKLRVKLYSGDFYFSLYPENTS